MTVHGATPPGPPTVRVAVSFVRLIEVALARFGANEFLASLDSREGYVDGPELAHALTDLASSKGVEHLGLTLAQSISLGWFGTLDYQFSTSATLGDAILYANPEIHKFVEGQQQTLEIDGDTARLVVRVPSTEVEPAFAPMRDFSLAIMVRRMRDVLGADAVKLTSVRLGYPAPPSIEAYDAFFRCPVSFGSGDTDEVAFPRDLLMAPLLTADPALARALSQLRSVDARVETPDPFVERVRALISQSLDGGEGALGADVIGSQLDLSGRSLQRKLKERGMSFSALVDDTRRALAEELLKRDSVLLCDVGYRLGFADVKAFFRAFRRWTGTSPRAFQKGAR
jgi:AraC-like DNA-binding protein